MYFLFGSWTGIVETSLRLLIQAEIYNTGSVIADDQIYNIIVRDHGFIIIFYSNTYYNC